GDMGVIFCAAGLGASSIANIREEERVYLPSKLGEKWDELELGVFKAYAEGLDKGTVAEYCTTDSWADTSKGTSLSSVAGDVYELSIDDIKKIVAMLGQITGIIQLTDPYNRYQLSFVTIPLSKELTDSLIINRERIVE
ncbi:uncharacterized protein BO80DRAFT_346299, partial [Aspergillus ibericus CBS 121593]